MSHLPFILQATLGIPPPERPRRTETLTDDLEAEFGDLNWSHCENGSANPVPVKDAVTIMGPATSSAAGKGSRWPNETPLAIQRAAHLLRQAGYKVPIVPDDYKPVDKNPTEEANNESASKRPKLDLELEYLKSDEYQEIISIINNEGEEIAKLSSMSLDKPWIVVQCTKSATTNAIQNLLKHDFALVELADGSSTMPTIQLGADGAAYSVTITNGGGTSPSTLFEMKRNGKVVAKALCTYKNSEMSSVGPTLELLEVAKKWRRHGLGSALMELIEEYYLDLCKPILQSTHGRVLFSVCYVTNAYASRWFQVNHLFQDLDGMGEELGKYLFPRLEEDEEE